MAEAVMRPLKDGSGYSLCESKEENVGIKCNHVLTSENINVTVNKMDNQTTEVIISDDFLHLDKRDKQEVVKQFISNMQPIPEEKLNKIMQTIEYE